MGPLPALVIGCHLKHHVKILQLFNGEANVPWYGSDLEGKMKWRYWRAPSSCRCTNKMLALGVLMWMGKECDLSSVTSGQAHEGGSTLERIPSVLTLCHHLPLSSHSLGLSWGQH